MNPFIKGQIPSNIIRQIYDKKYNFLITNKDNKDDKYICVNGNLQVYKYKYNYNYNEKNDLLQKIYEKLWDNPYIIIQILFIQLQ